MKKYTHFVGLDVHANSIAVAIADSGGNAVRSLGTVAHDFGALAKMLRKHGELRKMKICYEAGACGYSLYWQFTKAHAECVVVAPTLIPRSPGDKVKTDRRDAEKLARLLRVGELTAVWVPDQAHEALRDLVRAREACKRDKRRAQQRVEKLLLRKGYHAPRTQRGNRAGQRATKSFTTAYMAWLKTIKFEHASAQATLEDYVQEVAHQAARLSRLDTQIDEALAQAPSALREVYRALQALRAVAQTTAAVIAVEVGNFSRFTGAPQLMAWAGLTPREYSSGGPGRSNRGAITKTGNAALRRVLVEAAWHYRFKPQHSPKLERRRQGVSAPVLAIAHKAETRLHGRYKRMAARERPPTKISTAVARELLGFVWAIGCEAERAQRSVPTPRTRIYKLKDVA